MSSNGEEVCDVVESAEKLFFCTEGVKARKDGILKERLRTLIFERKMSEPDFFNSINMTRQQWYAISWGIQNPPLAVKMKICNALGVDSRIIWRIEHDI